MEIDNCLESMYEIGIIDRIPNEMPKYTGDIFSPNFNPEGIMKEMQARELFVSNGMYAFVSWKWVYPFVEWINGRKVLEVMAGRGWLAHALRIKGVDVIATDDFSWSRQRSWKEPITEVLEIDAVESIKLFGDKIDIVIMSWPYMDDTAYRVIKELSKVNEKAIVVYIGEYEGGCTANDKFFDHFAELEDDNEKWENVIANFQSWANIRDFPQLGRYTESKI